MALGLDPEGFGRSDFPLPGLPTDDYDETGLQVAYWGIVAHFGEAISQ